VSQSIRLPDVAITDDAVATAIAGPGAARRGLVWVRHPRQQCIDLGCGDSGEQAQPEGGETAAGKEQSHRRQQQDQASVRPACEGRSPGHRRPGRGSWRSRRCPRKLEITANAPPR
jgi:hypothetical protein